MFLTKNKAFFYLKNNYYILNTENGALIKLDKNSYEHLKNKNIKKLSNEEVNILRKNGFIIDKNEYNNFYFNNRNNYLISKHLKSDSLKIDIAVTNKCNFSCTYCFEKENLNNYINVNEKTKNEFRKNLSDYINNKIKNNNLKKITIVWYGGEPTLEYDFINKINKEYYELGKEKDIEFNNIIISNGYLINDKFISELKKYNTSYIQITLDGEKDMHNHRRKLKSNKGTYNQILNNIEKLISNKIETVIRINIDKENFKQVNNLIDTINKKFSKFVGKYLFIDLSRVFGSEYSYTNYEFKDIKNNFTHKLFKYKFLEPIISNNGVNAFCSAECDNDDLVIDIFGNVYKCWNYVYEKDKAYTTLKEIIDNDFKIISRNKNRLDYVEKASLLTVNEGECLSCEFLRYCKGLCPDQRKRMIEGYEENIYKNDKCKEIVYSYIESNIKEILSY
ncbi:radical SAM/SPASM domain Clo7bot peptide maturase [Tepiditoga spiralis]|uniref:Radical SAM/SPASM domain Clo7bot peptide maturase n=1 Tax=Tepiditoga spiralis TaxID=2108365 RepID=A0A7G1G6B6_9BACT|nr:radical SAM protein [Tepiditoga spiralis]BBE30353.1 radical SAM/SPASM domain Clo7bot peptide maturase [Tepiditoga spiralis]